MPFSTMTDCSSPVSGLNPSDIISPFSGGIVTVNNPDIKVIWKILESNMRLSFFIRGSFQDHIPVAGQALLSRATDFKDLGLSLIFEFN